MPAVIRTISTESGATFRLGFVYCEPLVDVDGDLILDGEGNPQEGDPVSLAGCVARMQIRSKVADETAWVTATSETFDVDDAPFGGRIFLELGSVTGRIDVVLTDEDTMDIIKTKGVYDFEIEFPIQSGEIRPRVERLLEGTVLNDLNVTRSV